MGFNIDKESKNDYLSTDFYDAYSIEEISGYTKIDNIETEQSKIYVKSNEMESFKKLTEQFNGLIDSPWPMFCYNTRHTGQSPYSTVDNPGIEKWRVNVGTWVNGGPVIDEDGIIYVSAFFFWAFYPNGNVMIYLE